MDLSHEWIFKGRKWAVRWISPHKHPLACWPDKAPPSFYSSSIHPSLHPSIRLSIPPLRLIFSTGNTWPCQQFPLRPLPFSLCRFYFLASPLSLYATSFSLPSCWVTPPLFTSSLTSLAFPPSFSFHLPSLPVHHSIPLLLSLLPCILLSSSLPPVPFMLSLLSFFISPQVISQRHAWAAPPPLPSPPLKYEAYLSSCQPSPSNNGLLSPCSPLAATMSCFLSPERQETSSLLVISLCFSPSFLLLDLSLSFSTSLLLPLCQHTSLSFTLCASFSHSLSFLFSKSSVFAYLLGR